VTKKKKRKENPNLENKKIIIQKLAFAEKYELLNELAYVYITKTRSAVRY